MVATDSQKVGKKNPSRSCLRELRKPPWMRKRVAIREQTVANRARFAT